MDMKDNIFSLKYDCLQEISNSAASETLVKQIMRRCEDIFPSRITGHISDNVPAHLDG